jgi:hypothetical protein
MRLLLSACVCVLALYFADSYLAGGQYFEGLARMLRYAKSHI